MDNDLDISCRHTFCELDYVGRVSVGLDARVKYLAPVHICPGFARVVVTHLDTQLSHKAVSAA